MNSVGQSLDPDLLESQTSQPSNPSLRDGPSDSLARDMRKTHQLLQYVRQVLDPQPRSARPS